MVQILLYSDLCSEFYSLLGRAKYNKVYHICSVFLFLIFVNNIKITRQFDVKSILLLLLFLFAVSLNEKKSAEKKNITWTTIIRIFKLVSYYVNPNITSFLKRHSS